MIRPLAALATMALLTGAATPARNPWVGAWGYAASPAAETPKPTRPAGTFRYRLRISQGGRGVALRLGNPEGSLPLAVASVSVARASAATGFAADPARTATLLFGGKTEVTLDEGTSRTSDPAVLATKAGDDLIVTVTTTAPSTDVGAVAGFAAEFAPADGDAPVALKSRPFATLLSVHAAAAPCTIVTLGDSITEGARGDDPVWRGWPGRLARRLAERDPARHCGVVNMGIGGNRLLAAGRGPSMIDRFGRDVAAVPGVTHVVLLGGINDIVRSVRPGERPLAAADLIAGFRRVIALGHARGLRVIGATMTPAGGSRFMTPALERIRVEANRGIRDGAGFDGVIDFEAAVADRALPPALRPAFDSGDHLHPGDAGYAAMADAVPLALFDATATLPARTARP